MEAIFCLCEEFLPGQSEEPRTLIRIEITLSFEPKAREAMATSLVATLTYLFRHIFQWVIIYKCNIRTLFHFKHKLAGVPGVARDENLQKQIFEITWIDKGWIG